VEDPAHQQHGNGYIYSSAFCSADDAEKELREGLGMLNSDTPRPPENEDRAGDKTLEQRHRRSAWPRPSSPGDRAPFIQRTATTFVEFLEAGDLGRRHTTSSISV
jgi:hypothetical protein